jgi:chromosome segregation ATPase
VAAGRDNSPEPDKGASKYIPFVLWLIPVIFGAGASLASLRSVAQSVETLDKRLSDHVVHAVSLERGVNEAQAGLRECSKDTTDQAGDLRELQRRVSALEQNVAALCAQRGAACKR